MLSSLVGGVFCVVKDVKPGRRGMVCSRWGPLPASSSVGVRRGRWVRVVAAGRGVLVVEPLAVWLGSCCC